MVSFFQGIDWLSFRLVMAGVAASACFVFSLVLFTARSRTRASFLFGLANLFLGFWNINDVVVSQISDLYWALFIDRLSYVSASMLVFVFLVSIIEVAGLTRAYGRILKFSAIVCVILVVSAPTSLLITNLTITPKLIESPGPLYPLFGMYFLGSLVFSLSVVWAESRKEKGVRRNQLRFVAAGVAFALAAGTLYVAEIMWPVIPPLFYLLETVYAFLIPYAIVRYRLMEFTLAVRYGLVYLSLGLLLGIPFGALAGATTGNWVAVLAGLIAPATGFFLIRGLTELASRIIDKVPIFGERYNPLRSLERMEAVVRRSGSMEEWCDGILAAAVELCRPATAFVMALDQEADVLRIRSGRGLDPARKVFLSLPIHEELGEYLEKTGEILLKDDIDKDAPGREAILEELNFLEATVLVPFFFQERLAAALILGPRPNGDMYDDAQLASLHALAKSGEGTLSGLLSGIKCDQSQSAWAHDLAQPFGLKGSLGEIESLAEGKHGPLPLEVVAVLKRVGEEMSFVGRNLNHVIRPGGEQGFDIRPSTLAGAYGRVRERFVRLVTEKGIKMRVDVPTESLAILCDEGMIEHRVLGNLVANALRHTPAGGSVHVGFKVEDKTFVGFVRDTGIGMRPEDISKVWEAGVQLDQKNKGVAGLGLFSVKSVVEAHHGKVRVESEPGKGACFYFDLPLAV